MTFQPMECVLIGEFKQSGHVERFRVAVVEDGGHPNVASSTPILVPVSDGCSHSLECTESLQDSFTKSFRSVVYFVFRNQSEACSKIKNEWVEVKNETKHGDGFNQQMRGKKRDIGYCNTNVTSRCLLLLSEDSETKKEFSKDRKTQTCHVIIHSLCLESYFKTI